MADDYVAVEDYVEASSGNYLPIAEHSDEEDEISAILGLGFEKTERSSCVQKIAHYWRQEGIKFVCVLLFVVVNVVLFLERFLHYRLATIARAPRGAAAYAVMSYGVCFARGAANALKFDTMLLLLLVCKNLLSYCTRFRLLRRLPLEKSKVFHKWVALTTLVMTAVHVLAHISNAVHIGRASVAQLSAFMLADPPTAPISAAQFVFTTRTCITGLLAVLVMIPMMALALQRVRRKHWEVFLYSHLVGFVLFYAMLLAHGANLLEPQVYWIWFLVGAIPYLLDRLSRWIFTYRNVQVLESVSLPGDVTRLRLRRPARFRYESGQYLMLCVPRLSSSEYHAFTITSSPELEPDVVGLHICAAGDWTAALQQQLQEGIEDDVGQVTIQGPFGTSSAGIFDYKVVMLVGGGIGVTPFASVLATIAHRLSQLYAGDGFSGGGDIMPLAYCEFVWVHRERRSFSWFSGILSELGSRDKLVVTTYHSRATAADSQHYNGVLRAGRPQWDHHFQRLRERAGRSPIGVFVCGPKALQHAVYQECRKRPKVVFHKEVF